MNGVIVIRIVHVTVAVGVVDETTAVRVDGNRTVGSYIPGCATALA